MKPDVIESLTQRETEMLWLLDARLSHEEIATVLQLSPEVFLRYRSRIYRKLRLRYERSQQPSSGP